MKYFMALLLLCAAQIAHAGEVTYRCVVVDTPGGIFNLTKGGTAYLLVTKGPEEWEQFIPIQASFRQWVRSKHPQEFEFHDGDCLSFGSQSVEEHYQEQLSNWNTGSSGKVVRVTLTKKAFKIAE